MKTDYCAYPPQLAEDVECAEQQDGDRLAFIAGLASVGRYILLREVEQNVLSLEVMKCHDRAGDDPGSTTYIWTLSPLSHYPKIMRKD